jgi:hypothetical protein
MTLASTYVSRIPFRFQVAAFGDLAQRGNLMDLADGDRII